MKLLDLKTVTILGTNRGKNHKKAKKIAGTAKHVALSMNTKADDTPGQSSHGGYSPNNFRLVT